MNIPERRVLLLDAIEASVKAGEEILKVYENTIEVEFKKDNSPLTIADQRSHDIIIEKLQPTGIPVLSEEGKEIRFKDRNHWKLLWVVDPLDGTKEFIKQNGEFTVNIALVEGQSAEMGVIYVPVKDVLYFGSPETGSYKTEEASKRDLTDLDALIAKSQKLPLTVERPFTMVGSRSHMNDETAEYFAGIRKEYPEAEIISCGSSLKICMVAEGKADVYPRFAPTMEWDTAAGHAIVKQVGFDIVRPDDNQPLQYNKEDLLNPWFIVK
ncbi:MAG TPA: 3'(2'),5'-bisphosphate nucleotidase [Cryomorphaceae bacterium]|nr:3'(2'),5'-bisphosphate nucleotidase [Owenweeksia sp.]MBF98117.1 3'(2'),5'-bisphosphate nucleotidase [Owenweeksia sp.]HAD98599.1 3'(2'),5'-bisphosphate nucleotidase [Cryomorphaceae bacterium]HBF20689.1 3'(2'),5'-bisphosphate nucleotidase [Cryomorphaceae bacterium]|tara:strand:+ start:515 stop:1318 length:804 start_codon:yes stop_codon:yes gene_type:complete